MPFAFLMTDYMKRLEAGDPRAVEFHNRIHNLWQTILSYLIAHRGREWWEVGCH
jgi:hypothetical protein